MRYFKFPKWLRRLYPGAVWEILSTDNSKSIYLTFDDGPNHATTEWILQLLQEYNAKATFFCIGKNVVKHPQLYADLQKGGHAIGNHTNEHLNGVNTNTKLYLQDIVKAGKEIDSKLFRPPYGKLKPKQYLALRKKGFKTVFWSHISYDFDSTLETDKRVEKALRLVKDGSIVVFHDSDKAFPQLESELPQLMNVWQAEGYSFKAIPVSR
ncbi:polysaccharide deacetylase family protein [Crocinitomix sp.]|nr:polysaccharide deacetylase family protein [Crocinitomix sp.]